MEKRDLLQQQIEQFARIISQIVSGLIGSNTNYQFTEAYNTSKEQLKAELNLDIDKVLLLEYDDLKSFIISLGYNDKQLEQLSEYFYIIGKSIEGNKEAFLIKAIELLEIADIVSDTLSLNRMKKKEKIKSFF